MCYWQCIGQDSKHIQRKLQMVRDFVGQDKYEYFFQLKQYHETPTQIRTYANMENNEHEQPLILNIEEKLDFLPTSISTPVLLQNAA